jgi:hypothetical protein
MFQEERRTLRIASGSNTFLLAGCGGAHFGPTMKSVRSVPCDDLEPLGTEAFQIDGGRCQTVRTIPVVADACANGIA